MVSFASIHHGYYKRHPRFVQSTPMVKKVPKEQDTYYKLRIHTGDLRGAGTNERVYVRLHGENGSSDQLPLAVELQRAMTVEAILKVQGDLGILERMEVGFVNAEEAEKKQGAGWLLDRVEVTRIDGEGRHFPKAVIFPCQRWIGQSESGSRSGKSVQALFPMSTEQSYPWRWGANERPVWRKHAGSGDLSLCSVAAAVPHPNKVAKGARGYITREFGYAGEDAFVIVNQGPLQLIAVADGVASWWELGIDAGEYSRLLLSCVKETALEILQQTMMPEAGVGTEEMMRQEPHSEPKYLDPVNLLQQAWEKVRRTPSAAGSCTACILMLDGSTNTVRAANLGDSGFMIVRIISLERRELPSSRPPSPTKFSFLLSSSSFP